MKIAVIGAMEQEVELLRNTLTNAQTETFANSEFTSGLIMGKKLYY